MTDTAITDRAAFDRIRYAQAWEDADVLTGAMGARSGGDLVSICASGDNALALLLCDPARVHAVDISPAQIECLNLRLGAYRALSHGEFLILMGARPGPSRAALLEKALRDSPLETQRFWSALRPEVEAHGAGGVGKFEHYFRIFARRLLPLVHSRATVEAIFALGSKDHSVPGQGLDPSDRDSGIEIGNWPVNGLYQPDTIGLIERNGVPYVLSANEGDTRDYDGYSEESRVSGLDLDPTAFPNAATLQANAALGRLTVTEANGDDDGDGDFDQLFVPGGRSFSIWEGVGGTQVYDSGDDFEQVTAAQVPALFNSQGDPGSFDNRSDNKGPEPEALTVGNVGGREFAFIGMERIGGVFAYDVEQPGAPELVSYSPAQGGDVSPEGMSFVPAALSPNGRALLLVAHEVSGTLGVYQVDACVVSAIVVNPLTVTVVGDCPGGFDLYRNGLLLQSGLVLNGALVLPLESLVGDRYFAALPGDNQPINGVVGSVVALQVPSLGTIGVIALGMLLVFMGGVALARKP